MSDISESYKQAFTSSMNAQGKLDTGVDNAKKELERLEKQFEDKTIDQDEYMQKKAMLVRKINSV